MTVIIHKSYKLKGGLKMIAATESGKIYCNELAFPMHRIGSVRVGMGSILNCASDYLESKHFGMAVMNMIYCRVSVNIINSNCC